MYGIASGDIPFPISNLEICPGNCSGHGVCISGTCLCQVQYSGWSCSDHNRSYFVSFGVFFYMVCLMAIVQLILCIHSDFIKLKRSNIRKACQINLQKSICLSVICAAGSRATYFIFGLVDLVPPLWKDHLFSTFYPFVLSGFSIIICLWAESFHLSDIQSDRSRFLTKSFSGFVVFNVIVYFMLISQAISSYVLPSTYMSRLNEIVNGGFAFLMFVVLIFFLIYGVEIFCKVEGAFKPESSPKEHLFNLPQLFQSRLGVIAQAGLQLAVTMFLMVEVLGELWKRKMSIGEQNVLDIAFHVAELGCALWFPCCLWNVTQPGELWILNPKKLLMLRRNKESESLVEDTTPVVNYNTFEAESQTEPDEITAAGGDCWICYDNDNNEDLIQPCDCKGGTRLVHHECLKTWLLERPSMSSSTSSNDSVSCPVCKAKYNVTTEAGFLWSPNGISLRAWVQTVFVVMTMAGLPVTVFFTWNKIEEAIVKMVIIVLLLVTEYFFLRVLGFNFLKAYKITKTRALKILGRTVKTNSQICADHQVAIIVDT